MSATAPARNTIGLASGSIVSGVLAYAVFALTTRALGSADAAPVAVLWTYWGLSAAALTFPVQHWIARSVAAQQSEAGVRADLPRLGLVVGASTVVTGLGAYAAKGLLFDGLGAFAWLVALTTIGSGLMGLVRGLLTARGRFVEVGQVLIAENAVRLLCVSILVLIGVTSPVAYGIALLAGYLACAGWPSAWSPTGDEAQGAGVLGFLGGATGGQVLGQVVLVGPPVLLALLGGGAAQVTALFAALALARAPFLVVLGQVAQLTGFFTRLVVSGRLERLGRLHRTITVGGLVLAGLAAGLGALLGPWLVRVVFGAEVAVVPVVAALLAAGSAYALANLVLSVLLYAYARTSRVLLGWLISVAPGALTLSIGPGTRIETVAWAFLVTEAAAWLVLALFARRR